MKRKSCHTEAFFALVRAGLWGDVKVNGCRLKVKESAIDWGEIMRLAEEQSVVGLVAQGIEQFQVSWTSQAAKPSAGSKFQVPKEWALQFIGQTVQIEQRNQAMNYFIGVIVEKMREAGIYTLLVKGQAVAQCYERPLWRSCGDVDFFLSEENYKKADEFLVPLASSVETDRGGNHGMTIDPWAVEIHNSLNCGLSKRIDNVLSELQRETFHGGKVRSWMNGEVQVFLLMCCTCSIIF